MILADQKRAAFRVAGEAAGVGGGDPLFAPPRGTGSPCSRRLSVSVEAIPQCLLCPLSVRLAANPLPL